jgi:hypothetical protein
MKIISIYLAILLVFLIISCLSAQNKLKGKVTDENSGEPLIGVNIYLNNSTIGTTTNKDGFYELNIPNGRFEIVVSIIGYYPESQFIHINYGSVRQIDFTLKEKIYLMNQVQIEDQFSDEWYKKLKVFKTYLLGQSDFSSSCKIINEKDILFSGDFKTNFTAHAYNPLKIRNDALGYLMECTIVNFEIDNTSMFCTYSIKTRFSDLANLERTNKVLWMMNRRRAYIGSLRHFLYSAVTKNNLADFEVALVKGTNYKERGTVVKSRGEIMILPNEHSDYLLTFKRLLRIRFKYNMDYSLLELSGNDSYVNSNGYLINPLSVIQYGNWANSGLSKLLPLEYISF